MYYAIFDEQRVKNLKLRGTKTILIRILEPETIKPSKIENIKDYVGILELHIKDYVSNIEEKELDPIFSKLNKFILTNDFDEIIIHCSLGISRSPAIMMCISQILNNKKLLLEIEKKFPFYNKLIIKEFQSYPYKSKNMKNKTFIFEKEKYIPIQKNSSKILIEEDLSKTEIIISTYNKSYKKYK